MNSDLDVKHNYLSPDRYEMLESTANIAKESLIYTLVKEGIITSAQGTQLENEYMFVISYNTRWWRKALKYVGIDRKEIDPTSVTIRLVKVLN